MKKILLGMLFISSLSISGCANDYLDNLDNIQYLVDKAYERVDILGVSGSLVNVKDLTDSVTLEKYWVPEKKIIPLHLHYVTTWTREFTKNDFKFTYNNISTLPNRYAIYQIESLSKYYIIYNEPLAVEGIFSVVLKSTARFDTPQEAINNANTNLIPKLVYDSTSSPTSIEEHVKSVSENFEIIEIFSPLKYSDSEEKIKKIYPNLIINNLSI